ncbi:MFS general substrate transporter [Atractiella rhizophila]|nr:MFS general substrate transporter [Atractiella rhizophila]
MTSPDLKSRSMLNAFRDLVSTPTPYHALFVSFVYSSLSALPLPVQPTLYRLFACRYYYHTHPSTEAEAIFEAEFDIHTPISHDPGNTVPAICHATEVEKLTGTLVSVLSTLAMICSLLSISFFSHLVAQWGRKRVILLVLCSALVSNASVIAAIWMYGKVGFGFLVFGLFLSGIFGDFLFMLSISNYIIDTVEPSSRAIFFAFDRGLLMFGAAVSSTLGGWSSSLTGKMKTPFWISFFGILVLLVLGIFLLPESLTVERRAAMASLYPENRADDDAKSTHTVTKQKLKALDITQNLKSLLPQTIEDERTGLIRTDYRVFAGTLAYGVSLLSSGFTTNMILLTITGRMKLDSKETGWVMSYTLVLSGSFLLFVFPLISKYGRKLFERKAASPILQNTATETTPLLIGEVEDGSASSDEVILESGAPVQHQPKANEFDRFLASVSWIIHAAGYIIFGCLLNWPGLLIALALVALSGGGSAALKSYVTNLVELPDKLLSGLAMVETLCLSLSPTIFGTIYALTLVKAPWAPWIVSAGTYLVAAIIIVIPRAHR